MYYLTVILLLIASLAWGANTPISTMPHEPTSDPQSYGLITNFLRAEDAAREAENLVGPIVVSGGTHATTSGMVSPTFATIGYTTSRNRVVQATATINYSNRGCATNSTAWVILSSQTTSTLGTYFREPGTQYFVNCASGTTVPTLPADSVPLMRVTIVSSSIADVTDLSPRWDNGTVKACRYGALDDVVAALGDVTPATILIACPLSVRGSLTVTRNLDLLFVGAGKLVSVATPTVTVRGGWRGPMRRLRENNVSVVFDTQWPTPFEVYPEQFGDCIADGTVDCTLSIIDAELARPVGGTLRLSQGTYRITNTILFNKVGHLRGTSRDGTGLYWTGTNTGPMIETGPQGYGNIFISDLALSNNGSSTLGIWVRGPNTVLERISGTTAKTMTSFIMIGEDTVGQGGQAIGVRVSNAHLVGTPADLSTVVDNCINIPWGNNIVLDHVWMENCGTGVVVGSTGHSTANFTYRDGYYITTPDVLANAVGIGINLLSSDVATIADSYCEVTNQVAGNTGHRCLKAVNTTLVDVHGNTFNGDGVADSVVELGASAVGVNLHDNRWFRTVYAVAYTTGAKFILKDNTGGSIVDEVDRRLAVNSTTPGVGHGNVFVTANTSATLISNFTQPNDFKEITILVNDNNTTIDCTSSSILCNTGVNFAAKSGDMVRCIYRPTTWWCLTEHGVP